MGKKFDILRGMRIAQIVFMELPKIKLEKKIRLSKTKRGKGGFGSTEYIIEEKLFKIQKRIIYAIEAVIDIALNSGVNPVQNVSIAKRQGIPKRYLEQTLQTLVKSKILVASRGPNGGYRLAKERRKILVSEIILSVSKSSDSDLRDLYNTEISKVLIEPLINKVTKKSFELLNSISVEDIYKLATNNKNQNLKKEES